jgi:YidC/Oxa1 family membrane protein insertase
MDKRTFLALLLTALVIVMTPLLFQGTMSRRQPPAADTNATRTVAPPNANVGATTTPVQAAPTPPVAAPSAQAVAGTRVAADTVAVRDDGARYAFTTAGASPLTVTLDDTLYRSLRPGERGQALVVGPSAGGGPLLRYRLVPAAGSDTIALDTIPFSATQAGSTVTFTSTRGPQVRLAYELVPGSYLVRVRGQVTGASGPGQILITLPPTLRSAEADTLDDIRHLSYGYKAEPGDVASVPFNDLEPTRIRTDSGPQRWVSLRNKYFLVAVLAPDSATPFSALRMRGFRDSTGLASRAEAVAVAPTRDGAFGFDVYAGPQLWQQLHTLGNDLENVHPYGGWLHGLVQPFATIVMRVLLWMKATLQLNYGWVLIIFGVLVRVLLWPLNQNAMRSSIKMQRIQPQLAELQKRYKTEPEKQRDAMIKLYQEHGMSPLSPMMGCLPMLLPMPVLFALYFVFQNTIEFRGVSFLWLPDLALKDPLYITPIFMGLSMLLLSWIGLRGAPPTPQAKMMAYMMPAMMTVFFLNFPSGLNLYYAVQNVAAMPQQWLLTRERAKAAPVVVTKTPAPPARRRGTG